VPLIYLVAECDEELQTKLRWQHREESKPTILLKVQTGRFNRRIVFAAEGKVAVQHVYTALSSEVRVDCVHHDRYNLASHYNSISSVDGSLIRIRARSDGCKLEEAPSGMSLRVRRHVSQHVP
jgi:hypothetical protein